MTHPASKYCTAAARLPLALFLTLALLLSPFSAPSPAADAPADKTANASRDALRQDPLDLPALLQAGIEARDSAAVLRHLDLPSLVRGVIERDLPLINEMAGRGEILLPPPLALALAGLNSGNPGLRAAVIDFLATELTKFVVFGVESGSFAGRPLPEDALIRMDGGVFHQARALSPGRKSLSSPEILEQAENSALIRAELFDAGLKAVYPLELRLLLQDGVWKVSELANTAALSRMTR